MIIGNNYIYLFIHFRSRDYPSSNAAPPSFNEYEENARRTGWSRVAERGGERR